MRITYTADFLRSKMQNCFCVSRKVKRKLKYYRIFVDHIPSRVTKRRHYHQWQDGYGHEHACCSSLVPIHLQQRHRKKRGGEASPLPSLLLANVRSFSNKFDEIKLRMGQITPTISVFTESWLDEDTPNSSIEIENFTIYRKDRNRRGGGILCYIRSDVVCVEIDTNDIPSMKDCESEFLAMFLKNIHALLICVYHPFWNDASKEEDAICTILDIIDFFLVSSTVTQNEARIILCGDFNDLRKHNDRLSSLTGLNACVDSPTRGDNLLDQIYINMDSPSKASILPPFGRSDHAAIFWKPGAVPPISTRKISIRKVTKSGMASFAESAARIDWLAISRSSASLDECALSLQNSIKCLVDECFPTRTIRVRSSEPPWMKPSLKLLINRRDKAYYEKKLLKYNRLKEDVINHIKHLKSHYINSLKQVSSKDTWKAINTVGRSQKKSKGVCEKFSVSDFNDFFASTQQQPILTTTTTNFSSLCLLPSKPLIITEREIELLLRSTKKKSCGPDGIPFWIFKNFSSVFAPAVTHLFNESLAKGQVPKCFKSANITPVPKVSHPKTITDFRPISLLPILSKLLEKLVAKYWILPYMHDVDDSQFAYTPCPGRGTTSALTLMYHYIIRFLDGCSGAVRVLTTDLSKAFDKLPHRTITDAASNYQLPQEAIVWISSFLKDRLQRTFANSKSSEWHKVVSGVPQGSVIGPLLFCLSVAALQPKCNNSKILKYADDVTLLHFIRNDNDDSLQLEMNNILEWSKVAGLPLNISKCSVMNIVTKRSIHTRPIVADAAVVPTVESVKILGVRFSNNLRWEAHINEAANKASRRLYVIRNLRRSNCSNDVMRKVYCAIMRPIMLYAFPCFCNAAKIHLNNFSKVEKRADRLMQNCLAKSDNINTAGEDMCRRFFEKIIRNDNHPLRTIFDSREPTRRNVLSLKKPMARTKRFASSFIRFCK